jgi:hypothetical protein
VVADARPLRNDKVHDGKDRLSRYGRKRRREISLEGRPAINLVKTDSLMKKGGAAKPNRAQ